MCFERIRVAGWRPRANDFVRDSRGIGGEPLCFGFEHRWEPDFAGKEKRQLGKEGSARHTGREPCWHGERKTNQRLIQRLS